jgi:uncharacterized protein DUF4118
VKNMEDLRVWVFIGAIGSILIGILLIPFRQMTLASNLAFVFLAFTIIVAELGGRSAAVVTALLSAISLNFFLTEPYLTLAMNKREDMIAFGALIGCGLISAAFGKRRIKLSVAAGRAAGDLDVLRRLTDQLMDGTSLEKILFDLKRSFGIGTMALRGANGTILAAAPPGSTPNTPQAHLNNETLFPSDDTRHRLGTKGFRLPEGGGRLSFPTPRGTFWIDLWEGDSQGLDLDESRTLGLAFQLLVNELAHRSSDPLTTH